jgi:RNA polymerase sigma-70 factor (ECF subfamily)
MRHNEESMDGMGDITRLLGELQGGNKAAESRLLEAVYPALRRIAKNFLSRERAGHTLQPTALVNEAYLQLLGQMGRNWQGRSHFYAVAAQIMRRILVDYARQRKAGKRHGGHRVELTDCLVIADDRIEDILLIDQALNRLAVFDPRRSKVVELRFFGGMTEEEVAEVLQVTARTVKRDWSVAKAWLYGELTSGA